MTIPNAVGKYQSEVPGSDLNHKDNQVPKLAMKNGSTQVHQGRACVCFPFFNSRLLVRFMDFGGKLVFCYRMRCQF